MSVQFTDVEMHGVALYKIFKPFPWLVWLNGLSAGLRTKGLLVRFPVRTHTWVAGQVPGWEHVKGNHTLMFLSLSFPPFPFL